MATYDAEAEARRLVSSTQGFLQTFSIATALRAAYEAGLKTGRVEMRERAAVRFERLCSDNAAGIIRALPTSPVRPGHTPIDEIPHVHPSNLPLCEEPGCDRGCGCHHEETTDAV